MNMDHLITDRTQDDVDRWRKLRDRGWDNLSHDERVEWMGEMKGRYGHTDMNRVESAVLALSARLRGLGYTHPDLVVKTNWTYSDVPTRDNFDRYFGNVAVLRNCAPVSPKTPMAPTTGTRLTYEGANDLEQILVDISNITTGIPKAWMRAGDIFTGEV